jgi:hypothetical protein
MTMLGSTCSSSSCRVHEDSSGRQLRAPDWRVQHFAHSPAQEVGDEEFLHVGDARVEDAVVQERIDGLQP